MREDVEPKTDATSQEGPPTESLSDFITAPVLAARVNKCTLTVRGWAAQGLIPSIKIGRSTLFHWDSVKQALLRQQRGGHL